MMHAAAEQQQQQMLELAADWLAERPALLAKMLEVTKQLYLGALARLGDHGADVLRRQYCDLISGMRERTAPQALLALAHFCDVCAAAYSDKLTIH